MGNKYVLCDPRKCTACKACMAACMVQHYVPGDVPLSRCNVVQSGDRTASIMCHHCENAPCASSCPTQCLYIDGDRVGIRMERCIGCRSCVLACPYGTIDVVERYDTAQIGEAWIGKTPRAAVIKCDRCYNRLEGPACIDACTQLALVLVDEDLVETTHKRRLAQTAAEIYPHEPVGASAGYDAPSAHEA